MQTDVIVLKGLKTGSAIVSVKILEPTYIDVPPT